MTDQENLYTEIFLLAVEYLNNTKQNIPVSADATNAYFCFYNENNLRLINNPLRPTAIEKAFIINKFLKKSKGNHRLNIEAITAVQENNFNSTQGKK